MKFCCYYYIYNAKYLLFLSIMFYFCGERIYHFQRHILLLNNIWIYKHLTQSLSYNNTLTVFMYRGANVSFQRPIVFHILLNTETNINVIYERTPHPPLGILPLKINKILFFLSHIKRISLYKVYNALLLTLYEHPYKLHGVTVWYYNRGGGRNDGRVSFL